MSDGGVKMVSHGKYIDGFLEFWRTMDRLGFEEELVFQFPSNDVILQIYIVDCAVIRINPNVYDTVRNKLRAIDYVAQLSGTRQSWSDNPALYASMQYVKRRNPGHGSDTLPVTASKLVRIIEHIMTNKVCAGLQLTKNRWISFQKIWCNPTRLWWYIFAVSVLIVTVLGLRGAECYRNENPDYEGYGLTVDDVTVYWQYAGTVYASNALSKATDSIHHIRVRLKNTKTGYVGKDTYLRIGRTHNRIEPAIILYHLYQQRLTNWGWRGAARNADNFLFANGTQSLSLQNVKKKWTKTVREVETIQPERYRFHGTRKGFATTLLQNGVRMSLIAYSGRWKLKSAIGRYLIHNQRELLQIAKLFLYGKKQNANSVDLDEEERLIAARIHSGQQQFDKECLRNTETLYNDGIDWVE